MILSRYPFVVKALFVLAISLARFPCGERTPDIFVHGLQLPLQREKGDFPGSLSYQYSFESTDESEKLSRPEWSTDWDHEPSEDETGHQVFAAASEAMLYWPQTVIVQGQSFVPVVIPAGTVLYHGRLDTNVPTVPEWLAFDFEHSHYFAGAPNGYMLSFTTKRALRAIAFDGLTAHQSLDTQEILMFGKVLEGDAPLAPQDAMCAWANKHGIDAFLRTEDHWEIINCDFLGTLKLLATRRVLPDEEKIDRSKPATTELSIPPPSFDGLSRGSWLTSRDTWKQDGPADPPRGRVPPPKGWIGSFPTYIGAETTTAAKWHDFAPGETRARPVLSKFVTFYDPAVKSLMAGRRGKTRDQHRLLGINDEEAKMVIKQLEDAVDDEAGWNEETGVSGVDWTTVLHVVVERYGERLEFLNHTLAGNTTAASKRSFKARQQVLTILTPYFTLFDTPPATSDSLDSRRAWLSPVVRRCAAAHTEGLPTHLFTKQEGLLLYAVQTVSHEICRRLGRTFSLAYDIDVIEAEMESDSSYDLVAEAMRLEISALLGWLDWVQVWVKCRPACSIDEYCLPSYGVPGEIPGRGRGAQNQGGRRFPQCVKKPNA